MVETAIAFWILTWVYAVEHPGGAVTERVTTFKNIHKTEAECTDKAMKAAAGVGPSTGGFKLTTDGGKALYSRFVCVPVPKQESDHG